MSKRGASKSTTEILVPIKAQIEREIKEGKRIASGVCRGMPLSLFRKYASPAQLEHLKKVRGL